MLGMLTALHLQRGASVATLRMTLQGNYGIGCSTKRRQANDAANRKSKMSFSFIDSYFVILLLSVWITQTIICL